MENYFRFRDSSVSANRLSGSNCLCARVRHVRKYVFSRRGYSAGYRKGAGELRALVRGALGRKLRCSGVALPTRHGRSAECRALAEAVRGGVRAWLSACMQVCGRSRFCRSSVALVGKCSLRNCSPNEACASLKFNPDAELTSTLGDRGEIPRSISTVGH